MSEALQNVLTWLWGYVEPYKPLIGTAVALLIGLWIVLDVILGDDEDDDDEKPRKHPKKKGTTK